jgi:hypothetical protein
VVTPDRELVGEVEHVGVVVGELRRLRNRGLSD